MKKFSWILIYLLLAGTAYSQKGKYGSTPEDSIACITNISLYKEHFKQKNYTDAKEGWINVFNGCPQSQKSTYLNGIKMYTKYIKDESNPDLKKGMVDTLFMIYDRRIEYWGQKGYVLGRKGSKWLTYYPDDYMGAYAILRDAVYTAKGKSEAGVLTTYYQVIYKAYAAEEMDKSMLITEYIPVSEFVDQALIITKTKLDEATTDKDKAKYQKKLDGYIKAKATIDDIFIKVATCEDIVPIVEKRVLEEPDNVAMLQKSLTILSKRDCADDEIFATVAVKLYDVAPSAKSAHGLGRLMLKRKNFSESAKYYKEAVDLCGDQCPDEIEGYLLDLATAYYYESQNKGAVKYAKKALLINPKNGRALLLVGRAIAASAPDCTSDEIERSGVYWLSTDYFYRAKAADPELAEQANKLIGTYKKHYASKDKVFFANLAEGDTYMVQCWGENTKVKIN
jgi:tetratricopeptide (TPR) repeat protein